MKHVSRKEFAPMDKPRTHENCKARYGVFRPGKTKADKANGSQRFHKNHRVWDSSSRSWIKG